MAEAAGDPIDLLRSFASTSNSGKSSAGAAEEDLGEIELSLGLSLGGCFGVGANDKGVLVRASSVASFSLVAAERPLLRTCSLPVEGDEEIRKRKEMQSLRRMEAKRKRSEKRGLKIGSREREDGKRGEIEFRSGGGRVVLGGGARSAIVDGDGWKVHPKGQGLARQVEQTTGVPVREGSIRSYSRVAGASDSYCRPMHALNISANDSSEAKNPSNIQSLACSASQKKSPVSPGKAMVGNPASCTREEADGSLKETVGRVDGTREMARTMMEQMPCVSTRGHGPNGKRIEGFLYKYGKGEEVRIVCVCHGTFLTPAEFVKHAGGGDVDHPLRHIVVNPSPSTFL